MKIAVLGGGHGSYASAADLSDQGHEVRLWGRNEVALAELLNNPTITLKDFHGSRDVTLSLVTTQIGAAVHQAELILIPTPAFAQEDIANALAPHLRDGQVLYLPPGTFGSYAMMNTLRTSGCFADIAIGETGTLPYLARKHGATQVAITTRATRLPTGIFPAIKSEDASKIIARAYPSIEVVEDALSGALMNAGPIIHPPLILMNAGPLEHFDRWDIHNEGTQPAIRRVTDCLDGERIAVREALGYRPYHFPLRDHYTSNQWMYGDAHDRLVDSGDWREKIVLTQHRYMLEDVHYGLAFLVSVADWAGVAAPTAKALLSLASAVCGSDLRQGRRTLESLGLANMSAAEMQEMLRTGYSQPRHAKDRGCGGIS
jgi:opine dehydrogenase